jgi:hypothetical protein
MSELKTKLPTDTWVVATWEEFIAMADDPTYNKAKCYYRNGQMRIETMSYQFCMKVHRMVSLKSFPVKDLFYAASLK